MLQFGPSQGQILNNNFKEKFSYIEEFILYSLFWSRHFLIVQLEIYSEKLLIHNGFGAFLNLLFLQKQQRSRCRTRGTEDRG